MTDVQRIISELEEQQTAIERAIAALREISWQAGGLAHVFDSLRNVSHS